MLTDEEKKDIQEIHRLLKEAYDYYFTTAIHPHTKSAEGTITVDLGNYWERNEAEEKETASWVKQVTVYSYLFAPHRSHYFKTTTEALDAVREWHREAMATDWSKEPF